MSPPSNSFIIISWRKTPLSSTASVAKSGGSPRRKPWLVVRPANGKRPRLLKSCLWSKMMLEGRLCHRHHMLQVWKRWCIKKRYVCSSRRFSANIESKKCFRLTSQPTGLEKFASSCRTSGEELVEAVCWSWLHDTGLKPTLFNIHSYSFWSFSTTFFFLILPLF